MAKATEQPPIFWNSLKSMTLWGYFTSEVGQTQALNYVMTPGRYDAEVKIGAGYKMFE